MLDTYSRTDHNVAHVVPVDDLVEHVTRGFACPCGPKVEYERHWCGVEDGWIVIHHALNGSD